MNRYIVPVLLILLSVGVYIIYLDPVYVAIEAGNTKIAEYNKLLNDAQVATQKIERLKTMQEHFPSGYDESLATILPVSVDPLKLVININGIAALRGLHIKAPSVSIASEQKNTSSVAKNLLTFTVSAPYTVFRSFLRDLESSLALQDLSQMSFTSSVSESTSANYVSPELKSYDYQVSVITYSLPK